MKVNLDDCSADKYLNLNLKEVMLKFKNVTLFFIISKLITI